ncbi:MAG: exodeoxyribonuclease V subunit alpha [Bacteroidales bacterium]
MQHTIDVHRVFAEYFTGVEALAYAVSTALEEGSICLDTGEYLSTMGNVESAEQKNPFWKNAADFRKQMQEGRFVAMHPAVLKPFMVYGSRVYLQRYFHYETLILEQIAKPGNHFRIITGGPGTGKTYGVAQELVRQYEQNPALKVAMAAPTGKAAARLNESIRKFAQDNNLSDELRQKLRSQKARTLHGLLGYQHNSVFFRYHREHPLPFDVLVVDEASMIDGPLMAKLLDATGDHTQLFLLGDKDQLASVEAGSVFGDICRAKDCSLLKDRIEVKTKNWRAKDYPQIIALSEKIIGGDAAYVQSLSPNEQVVIDTAYHEALFNEHAALYLNYVYQDSIEGALKALDDIRFLCVTREHDRSVKETNKKIEAYLKAKVNDPSLFSPKPGFYHNQPILITQNNRELNVYNGDTGLVRKDPQTDVFYAWFASDEGGLRKIPAGYLSHFETVFAMTIHKSQGSDFDHVVVLLPEKRGGKLLTRELLYTGVTRARKKVVLQATPTMLEKCISTSVSRASGLTERLQSASL